MPTHRLLADEMLPDRVVFKLRAVGHDVSRVRDSAANKGGDGQEDEIVLQIAAQQRRATVTFNRKHFARLHREASVHFGIVVCYRDDKNPDSLGKRIDDAIRQIPSLKNQFIVVEKVLPEHQVKQKAKAKRSRYKDQTD